MALQNKAIVGMGMGSQQTPRRGTRELPSREDASTIAWIGSVCYVSLVGTVCYVSLVGTVCYVSPVGTVCYVSLVGTV